LSLANLYEGTDFTRNRAMKVDIGAHVRVYQGLIDVTRAERARENLCLPTVLDASDSKRAEMRQNRRND
jgi:hypothetical protein